MKPFAEQASSDSHLFFTAVVSDVLDQLGIRDRAAGPGIVPMWPGAVIRGRARTFVAVGATLPPLEPYQTLIRGTDSLQPGDVVVASVEQGVTAALWGELFSTAAIMRGATGAVVDGFVRDTRQIAEMQFPLFARGTHPTDSNGRMEVTSFDEIINVGGVQVTPGDGLIADGDGIVFIPRELVREVEHRALEKMGTESAARSGLARGMLMAEIWDEFHVL